MRGVYKYFLKITPKILDPFRFYFFGVNRPSQVQPNAGTIESLLFIIHMQYKQWRVNNEDDFGGSKPKDILWACGPSYKLTIELKRNLFYIYVFLFN
jgi:hypothetical protein